MIKKIALLLGLTFGISALALDINTVQVDRQLTLPYATPSTAMILDPSGNVISSPTTSTELGYVHGVTSSIQTQLNSKQPGLTVGNLTDSGTDGITVTGGTGAVIGSGTSIAQQAASGTLPGYLSAANFLIFNAKQPAGNYLTALVGDGVATGPGSASFTLATVNSNVGSFGTASSVSAFTVNAKGLITAAGNTSIQIAESQVTNLTSDLASKLSTSLPDAEIFVGDSGGVASAVEVSGDATMDDTGALTLATVNSNTGTFASVTVNAKGLVTAAAALSGDATTSGSVLTLKTVNSNTGTFGSASSVGAITVNGKGLVTAASSTSIQIAESQVTNLTTDLAGKLSTALAQNDVFVGNVSGVATGVAMSGDASIVSTGALTLATVNANTGSFGSATSVAGFTVNGKGLITAASSTSIQITESQVTNLTTDLAGKLSTALTSGDIFVGSALNVATGVVMSGDATIVASGALTLATVNSNVGSFGSASSVGGFTVNAKGLVTAASNTSIQITESQVTNLTTDLAAKISTTLTSGDILVGNASNVATAVVMSGDATIVASGALTLATVNSNVGSFGSASSVGGFTVNAKGLVTAASSTSIQITESQVTSLTSDLAGKLSTALTQNNIFVGSASNLAAGVAMSGDASIASTGALTLATVNSNVGSFGSATSVSAITVNGKGLVTAASSTSIQIAESQVTNLTTDLAGKLSTSLTSAQIFVGSGLNVATGVALSGDATIANTGALTLATVNSNVGTFAVETVNGKGLVTAAANMSGDLTTSGAVATLATVNSNVGSFTNASITVNAKGLITAASNGTGASPTSNYAAYTQIGTYSATSASWTDPSISTGSNTITLVKNNGITLTAAGSNLLGITWTPSSSSNIYMVTATMASASNIVATDDCSYRLYDGTTVWSDVVQQQVATSQRGSLVFSQVIVAPNTASAYTLKIQIWADNGTCRVENFLGHASGSMLWSVVQIN